MTYHLNITRTGHDPANLNAVQAMAELHTADPVVAAATLRAVADQLDPPRPVHRDQPRERRGQPVTADAGRGTVGNDARWSDPLWGDRRFGHGYAPIGNGNERPLTWDEELKLLRQLGAQWPTGTDPQGRDDFDLGAVEERHRSLASMIVDRAMVRRRDADHSGQPRTVPVDTAPVVTAGPCPAVEPKTGVSCYRTTRHGGKGSGRHEGRTPDGQIVVWSSWNGAVTRG